MVMQYLSLNFINIKILNTNSTTLIIIILNIKVVKSEI